MKVSDVNAFKGQIKDAALNWAGSMIDQMLPNKVAARTMFKNAIGNIAGRLDGKINQAVDIAFLMFGDSAGTIDTDSSIDMLCNMLSEMKATEYSFGIVDIVVGQGEIKIQFPHNIFSELLVGDVSGVKITASDIKEIKNYLN